MLAAVAGVLAALEPGPCEKPLWISIAAGVPLSALRAALPERADVAYACKANSSPLVLDARPRPGTARRCRCLAMSARKASTRSNGPP
mgnify:CR=1 FL=1